MKPLSNILIKSAGLLFVLFSLLPNSSVEAFVEVNPVTPTETVSSTNQQKQNKKEHLKQLRKDVKKWIKDNRKKLGLGAGLLSVFNLLAWRRKLKKLKKKSKRLNDFGEGGCLQMFLGLVVIGLIALLGQWLVRSVFGIMVGHWIGALLGLVAIGLVILIIWLIVKAVK